MNYEWLMVTALALAEVDEGEAREHEDDGEGHDPAEGAEPPDAVDIEEEVGEPLVAGDEVAAIDEGDIEIGEEDARLDAAHGDLAHGACGKEVEGVEDGGDEV